jgi:hypothetical protein
LVKARLPTGGFGTTAYIDPLEGLIEWKPQISLRTCVTQKIVLPAILMTLSVCGCTLQPSIPDAKLRALVETPQQYEGKTLVVHGFLEFGREGDALCSDIRDGECFLERLTLSAFAKSLVRKGGVLLPALDARRPRRDIDLAASALNNHWGRDPCGRARDCGHLAG